MLALTLTGHNTTWKPAPAPLHICPSLLGAASGLAEGPRGPRYLTTELLYST